MERGEGTSIGHPQATGNPRAGRLLIQVKLWAIKLGSSNSDQLHPPYTGVPAYEQTRIQDIFSLLQSAQSKPTGSRTGGKSLAGGLLSTWSIRKGRDALQQHRNVNHSLVHYNTISGCRFEARYVVLLKKKPRLQFLIVPQSCLRAPDLTQVRDGMGGQTIPASDFRTYLN